MIARPRWTVQLPIVFAAVILVFVAAIGFSNWRLTAIDSASLDIANNAAPSIELLAKARSEMRRSQVLLREYLDRRAEGFPADDHEMNAALRASREAIAQYLALPVFADERSQWGEIVRDNDELTRGVALSIAESRAGRFANAERAARVDVSAAADRLDTAITSDIAFNAEHSRDLALAIQRLRSQSVSITLVLTSACIALTILGAFVLRRAMNAHSALAKRHEQLLEARADELEQFSGRVAHDILSPLGIVSLALEMAGGASDEQARARFSGRGMAALARVKRIVQGLLEFARAGAKPEPNERTEVGTTVDDLAVDLCAEAKALDIELVVDISRASAVACNEGVLTSVVANLARNAIKYIGDRPVKRITIRAFDRGEVTRIEVQDTGPGLPPTLEPRVFEAYVRGVHAPRLAGIGLGLATVKRLAEAHGGSAGVHSVSGEGCTFWVELPKAEVAAASTAAPVHATDCS